MVGILEIDMFRNTAYGGKMTDYLLNGTILKGRYTIKKKITNSDFSNIYLGSSKEGEVIIKECFPKSLVIRGSDGEVFTVKHKKNFDMIKKSFLKEAEILGNLSHTNIVKIYDKFKLNNTVYIVMEYCKGSTLREFILESDFTEEKNIKLFLRIIKAVKYIHRHGYLHRDIKPSNIIIKGKTFKILDFGSAIEKKSKNGEYIRITAGYSPMEMHSLKSTNDESTDIYSLSAMFYFMLNKQKPMDILKRFYYDELIFREYISDSTKELITKGLSVNNKDRYQSILEIEKELEIKGKR